MRLLGLLPLLWAAPLQAAIWYCDPTLTPDDLRADAAPRSFKLHLSAPSKDAAARTFRAEWQASADWFWQGRWTPFEGQIFLIGPVTTPEPDAPPSTREMRAVSTIYKDDVIILNLHIADDMRVARCLKETL